MGATVPSSGVEGRLKTEVLRVLESGFKEIVKLIFQSKQRRLFCIKSNGLIEDRGGCCVQILRDLA